MRLLADASRRRRWGILRRLQASQFVRISVPGCDARRAYSPANVANWDGELEFYIRLLPGGRCRYLMRHRRRRRRAHRSAATGEFGLSRAAAAALVHRRRHRAVTAAVDAALMADWGDPQPGLAVLRRHPPHRGVRPGGTAARRLAAGLPLRHRGLAPRPWRGRAPPAIRWTWLPEVSCSTRCRTCTCAGCRRWSPRMWRWGRPWRSGGPDPRRKVLRGGVNRHGRAFSCRITTRPDNRVKPAKRVVFRRGQSRRTDEEPRCRHLAG